MPTRLVLLLSLALLSHGCGGGDKHLPSSNPPEYDPKKVYTVPAALPNTAAVVQPVVPLPSSPAKSPPMDRVALRNALEAADRTRDILEKVGSLDSQTQLHAILDAMMRGEQAPPELRSTFRETFEAHKVQIHEAFEKQYNQYQQVLGEGRRSPTMPPPLRKSGGSESFSLFRVSARGVKGTQMPWTHLVDLPRGATVNLEPDCCGAWHIVTIPDSAFEGGGFNLEIKSAGRYNSDKDHISVDGEAITTTTKVVAGDKATVKVKITKKNRAVVNRCPSASGVVPGDASIYEEMGYNVSTPTMNHSAGIFVHDRAKTEAQTDEEGFVQEIKMEVTAEDLDGETGQVLRQASGNALKKRDMPVVCSGCTARVADAAKKLGRMASWNYYNAEQLWRKPVYSADACVKIHFTPATKTVSLSPAGSTKVKAELRTVGGDQATEGRLFELQELNDGKVTPKDEKTGPQSPAVITFTAPNSRWSKSAVPGFRVFNSSSRAGGAWPEEWELAPSSYVLEFKSHIVQEPLNLPNPPFGMFMSSNGFDAHVQATVPLQRRDDGQWVGEGVMQYATRTLTQPASCEIRIQGAGTTTFHVNGGSISSDPEPFAVNLIILPGQSGEVAETHCVGSNDQKLKELMAKANPGVPLANEARVVSKGGGWSGAFNFTRFRTFNMAKKGYAIGSWTPVRDSDVIAKKTMQVNCSMGLSTCREETTLTLRLADEPGATASPPR
jgi:hypothetical protein